MCSSDLYRNHSFDISQYTMSEIVASVYETIEKSGKNEGILFLDEINCVSETHQFCLLVLYGFRQVFHFAFDDRSLLIHIAEEDFALIMIWPAHIGKIKRWVIYQYVSGIGMP